MVEAPPNRRFPWRTFAFLVAATTVTAPLVLPYFRGLQQIAPQGDGERLAIATTPLVLLVLARSLVLSVPAAGLGLLLSRRLGLLGAPYLEHWLDAGSPPVVPFGTLLRPAVLWALGTAAVALAVDGVFLHAFGVDFPAPEIHARIAVEWWRSGLASFWAPFAEEVLDRLCLVSLVAWPLVKVLGTRPRGRTVALALAVVVTALFFGWYHLANEQLFAATVPPMVAARTILIILPVGLAFGWLFLRYGLEAAILSHFVIDLLVHVVRPLVESWLRR